MTQERIVRIVNCIILVSFFLWMGEIVDSQSSAAVQPDPAAIKAAERKNPVAVISTRYYPEKDYSYLEESYGRTNKVLKAKLQQYHEHVNRANYLLCRLNMLAEDGKANSPEFKKINKQFNILYRNISFQEQCFNTLDPHQPIPVDNTRCGVLTSR